MSSIRFEDHLKMKKLRAVLLFLAVALGLSHGTASASAYPSEPVHIIVAYPAGSTMDNLARMLAADLQSRMGAPFIIDNKPGAAGQIGAEAAARAKPDGYTLFISGSSTHSANPALFKQLRYDPVKDFTPVIHIASVTYALVVNADSPARTVKELAAQSKSAPQGLSFGYGSQLARVAGATISRLAGVRATEVPYKGQPPAISDLLGGQIQFLIADIPVLLPQIKAGKLRPLAVLTPQRSPLLPEVPTLTEQGLQGYDLDGWIGLSAPANTPRTVVDALAKATAAVISNPSMHEHLSAMGMEYRPGTPERFGKMVQDQVRIWKEKVHDAGIPAE